MTIGWKQMHDGLRWQALTNLWEDACNQLVVRYPDPRVEVSIRLGHTLYYGYKESGVLGEFWMTGLRDTRNPDRLVNSHLGGFGVGWVVDDWYGYAAARYYLTSAWRSFLTHEAAESVLDKSKVTPGGYDIYPDDARVYDPHLAGEFADINRPIFHLLQPGDKTFKLTLKHLLDGTHVDAILCKQALSQAQQQLKNEINFLENN